VSSNENAKLGQKNVTCGSRDPLLEFWDDPPPNISGTDEVRNLKFGTETYGSKYKSAHVGSCDQLLKFWDPLNISGTV